MPQMIRLLENMPAIGNCDCLLHVSPRTEASHARRTVANCWHIFKETDRLWGKWTSAVGMSFSKVSIEAFRPHPLEIPI